jgi:DnaJ-class molecular chaperone
MTQSKILKYCMVLGLKKIPDEKDLKTAYHKMIFEWHPDKHANDAFKSEIANKKSQEINAAYEFISEVLESTPSDVNFEQYSKQYKTEHKYKNHSFEPGFPDPFVFEIFLKSSHIISAGYNRATRLLYVKFKPNSVYKYHDLPSSVFDDFINAPSHGKYLNKNIAYKFKYEHCSEPNHPYKGNSFITN